MVKLWFGAHEVEVCYTSLDLSTDLGHDNNLLPRQIQSSDSLAKYDLRDAVGVRLPSRQRCTGLKK